MLPALLAVLSPVVNKVLDFIPNTAAREKARAEFELSLAAQQIEIFKVVSQSDLAQADINKIEAGSDDKFKSYWRPAVAWVCVVAYAWMYVLQPVVTFALVVSGQPIPTLPQFDLGELTPVLMGMLGLAGLRTYEKVKGPK